MGEDMALTRMMGGVMVRGEEVDSIVTCEI